MVNLVCHSAADVGRKEEDVGWPYLENMEDYVFFHIVLVNLLLRKELSVVGNKLI